MSTEKLQLYKCEVCGNLVQVILNGAGELICCGQPMKEIVPGTSDASLEKHVPVYEVIDNVVKVKVGSIEHPMTKEHYIEWISLQTKNGNQRKTLSPEDKPEASFAIIEGDEVESVFAYCNLHSLWKA